MAYLTLFPVNVFTSQIHKAGGAKDPDTQTFKEAMSRPYWEQFIKGMLSEIAELECEQEGKDS